MKVYDRVILHVFERVQPDAGDPNHIPFTKTDIEHAVVELGVEVSAKNIPDIVYTYRSGRSNLPEQILASGQWAIIGEGKGAYAFQKLERSPYFDVPNDIVVTPILDATPQIVLKYQSSDEQAVLAQIRYNRLIDLFTGLTCYHLQGHFRTTVAGTGQVEIDDLYIGLNMDGEAFVLPIEAKIEAQKDRLGVVQITQMIQFAETQFPDLTVRPLGIKVMPDGSLMFIEFTADADPNTIATITYRRYQLVSA